jgi:hypothetical protein
MWNCCMEICKWGNKDEKLKKIIAPFPVILK